MKPKDVRKELEEIKSLLDAIDTTLDIFKSSISDVKFVVLELLSRKE